MKAIAFLSLMIGSAYAQPLERCSYSTEHNGSETKTIEEPSPADGSDQKRFAEIKSYEETGKEGWKGYRTFDVDCRPLDNKTREYSLFVQTENGQVSLIRDLTEAECYHALYATDTHRYAPNGSSWVVQGSDYKQGQCLK